MFTIIFAPTNPRILSDNIIIVIGDTNRIGLITKEEISVAPSQGFGEKNILLSDEDRFSKEKG